MKKKLFIVPIILICLIFGFSYIKADSGWDTDYDFGGSSDWGSSSSYSSYDYSYGSSSYSDGDAEFSLLYFVLIVGGLIVFGAIDAYIIEPIDARIRKRFKKSKRNKINSYNKYNDITEEEAAKYGINLKEFKIDMFNKYVEIQNAWSEFDYDKLKELLTDE